MISLNRALTYSDQFTLAKGIEAQMLYRDMQFDAVDQLTRRLAVVRSLHPSPSEAALNRVDIDTPVQEQLIVEYYSK